MRSSLRCFFGFLTTIVVLSACFSVSNPTPVSIYDPENRPSTLPTLTERLQEPLLWVMSFYQNQDVSQLASVIEQLDRSGFFESGGAQEYFTAFLVAVLRLKPQETADLASQCDFLEGNGETILACSLWIARTDESKAQLKRMAQTKSEYNQYLGVTPPAFLPQKITTITGLNASWGIFHASGDQRYLNMMIGCLDEDIYRKTDLVEMKQVNQLAVQILTDNCVRDPLVMNYCVNFSQDCPPSYQYDLDRMIGIAKKQLNAIAEEKIRESMRTRPAPAAEPIVDTPTQYGEYNTETKLLNKPKWIRK